MGGTQVCPILYFPFPSPRVASSGLLTGHNAEPRPVHEDHSSSTLGPGHCLLLGPKDFVTSLSQIFLALTSKDLPRSPKSKQPESLSIHLALSHTGDGKSVWRLQRGSPSFTSLQLPPPQADPCDTTPMSSPTPPNQTESQRRLDGTLLIREAPSPTLSCHSSTIQGGHTWPPACVPVGSPPGGRSGVWAPALGCCFSPDQLCLPPPASTAQCTQSTLMLRGSGGCGQAAPCWAVCVGEDLLATSFRHLHSTASSSLSRAPLSCLGSYQHGDNCLSLQKAAGTAFKTPGS